VVVSVADDDGEELALGAPGAAYGDWRFHDNTDGGVLAGFPASGWSFDVETQLESGIEGWVFRGAVAVGEPGAGEIALDPAAPLNITAHAGPAPCRRDCTLPRCGDGVIDAGEQCDDGDTEGGECPPTCQLSGGST
jgi:cysteine-rich repeat protein